ncbi:phytoene desaturase family protein [Kallotenue papyrolyticum]|uniref:phytoene desaturase family protein n=1 Tax=Kallotenue papyrolyticum TaxID=1325125 RepID=UPI000492554B|nr:phytoene desaturase family protein [Kallotenue papyrolyticum]
MPNEQIIVGGGLGGLAAAIHLARLGLRVRLLEKNEQLGGKLSQVVADGYRFDTGPSLLTMPWVVRELFAAAGQQADDWLTIVPVDPICRYVWPDGTRWEHHRALPDLIADIARLAPQDVIGFFRLMAFGARIYQATAAPFLLAPFRGWHDFLTPRLVRDAPALDAFHTLDQAVRRYLRSPYLRQVFNRYATYNGSSPYRTPATFAIIPYIEFATGGWYIKGGMYVLVQALQRLAERLGVAIETRSEVVEVLVRDRRARGVRLADGRELPAARVIVNSDALHGLRHLVAPEHRRHWSDRRIDRQEPSCSGFVVLLGIDRDYPLLAHHTLFFSSDYPAEFRAIFERQVPAPEPTIYVAATCRSDPDHAPPGGMNLFVLVNAPALSERVAWEREAGGYRDLVIRLLERRGLPDLQRHIRYEQLITPLDFAERTRSWRGALYGAASNQPLAAFLRPPLRAPDVRDLFFVGGATHPGGGMPLVLLSGRAVAGLIAREIGVHAPGRT